MKLTLYQIDAFTNKLFGGNPAAVIPLQQWLDTELMQKIALENNLSETVFFVPSTNTAADYEIRWFTPTVEINLCGHATLASAYVLFNILKWDKDEIRFSSKSGILKIHQNSGLIKMDFPSWKPERLDIYPNDLPAVLGGLEIVGVYQHRDILVELVDEEAVRNCSPDFTLMKKSMDKLIITAPGAARPVVPSHRVAESGSDGASDHLVRSSWSDGASDHVDFVSRFFAPGVGVDEDPVTGSAHSQLIPFWSEKLNKKKMHALQLSHRGGEIWCEQLNAERVTMAGNCVYYMKGEIEI